MRFRPQVGVPTAAASHNGLVTPQTPEDEGADPVILVSRIAESLPALDADALERLAQALDELTEAVGLRLAIDADGEGE